MDSLTRILVTGTLTTDGGAPQTGYVTFRPVLVNTSTHTIYVGQPLIAAISQAGAISIPLPATDDPATATPGFVYLVEEPSGWTYQIQVPIASSGGTLDLSVAPRVTLSLAAIATSGSASDLTTGTAPTARLGSGTASATTYLRGDRSYADPTLQAPPVHAVGNSGSTLTIDASSSSGWVKTITLNANCTLTLTGATSGRATTLELILTQDGTGSRTVTWPAAVKWSGGAPTLSTTAAAVDRVVLVTYNGGTTWYGDLVGTGYA